MAMSYTTNEAKKYKAQFQKVVARECERQKWTRSENKSQHYYMDCVFYFPRTDKDANNYFKCLADAITEAGTVWLDDTQLCERVQGIFYDSENPRIEITIRPVDYIGVFENALQFDQFEVNCLRCSKYKDGKCSTLLKAKEGRIQGAIQNGSCEKFKTKIFE